jgi:hypothetical protein
LAGGEIFGPTCGLSELVVRLRNITEVVNVGDARVLENKINALF